MGSNSRPAQLVTILLIALAVVIGGYRLWQHGQKAQSDLEIRGGSTSSSLPSNGSNSTGANNSGSQPTVSSSPQQLPSQKPDTPTELVVHVAGAVFKPAVYHMPLSSRVEDAIKMAGGASKNADLDALNLAAHLEDGTQLFVPEKETISSAGTDGKPTAKTSSPVAHPAYSSRPNSDQASKDAKGHSAKSEKLHSPKDGTVNLNTATEAQLQRLPGVGPSTAAKIIEHRKEVGKFEAIEQIQDVKGIGPKKFEKMKGFLRVR